MDAETLLQNAKAILRNGSELHLANHSLEVSGSVQNKETGSILADTLIALADEYVNSCKAVKFFRPEPSEKYQLWIMLEKWKDDDKQNDLETCLLVETPNEDTARAAFDDAQLLTFEYMKTKFQ